MSTDIAMLGDVMDVDALQDTGPYKSTQTTNLVPGGPDAPEYDRARFDVTMPGTSPQGGISYIDQAVGGWVGPREDASAGPATGIVSYRSRTQPFNGDFIGARFIPAGRLQGEVGRQRGNRALRATSTQAVELPDRANVIAGFLNPALSALLNRKGK